VKLRWEGPFIVLVVAFFRERVSNCSFVLLFSSYFSLSLKNLFVFVSRTTVKRATFVRAPVARAFGGHAADHHHHEHKAPAQKGIVVPDLVDTLEWVLDSPPNVHQFEEPPVRISSHQMK
jgi:hypothetical protein